MTRPIEFLLAVTVALILAPIILVVAMLVLAFDGAPAIFVARRCTLGGREFDMFKFRTMTPGPGTGVTGGDKTSRITPLGGFLRRTRLDELPQVWNILRGDLI